MPPESFLAILLRIGELAFSGTVIGLTAAYLYRQETISEESHRRFVYTEVVAALAFVVSVVFLLQYTGPFAHFPVDFVLFILLITAFALLANFIRPLDCGSIWDWRGITGKSICEQLKTDIVFCFLAAILFLASGILGLWLILKRHIKCKTADGEAGEDDNNIPWYHRERI